MRQRTRQRGLTIFGFVFVAAVVVIFAVVGFRVLPAYIESVGPQDVFVTKDGNAIVATATWTRKLHLVANASLFLEFEATATR